jgi:DNA-binding GntR family transcriptional regulator
MRPSDRGHPPVPEGSRSNGDSDLGTGAATGQAGGQGEQAYREIKERILVGQLDPGTRLVEGEVGKSLGISRTPVREALRKLVSDGLISRDGGGGLVVHRPSAREIEGVHQIREVLDGLAARLAARRATDIEVARLELALQAVREAAELESGPDPVAQMASANIVLFEILYQASGSERLVRMSVEVRDSVRLFSREAFGTRERAADVVGEQEAMVAAIQARAPATAEAAAREHIRNARRFLILRLTERQTQLLAE